MPDDKLEILYDRAAREIGELQRSAGLAFVVRLGEILVRHVFGGDLALLRWRGTKHQSLNRLAQRDDVSFSAPELSVAVSTFEVAQRHSGFNTCKNIGSSHVRAVLALPAPDQDRLLLRAENEDWTVERLSAEVAKLRPSKGPRPGRPRKHPLLKAITSIDGALAKLAAIDEIPDLADLDTATLVAAEERLMEAEETLGELLRTVRAALVVPAPPDPLGPPVLPDPLDTPIVRPAPRPTIGPAIRPPSKKKA